VRQALARFSLNEPTEEIYDLCWKKSKQEAKASKPQAKAFLDQPSQALP
jgi:hypothetical protein